MKGNRKNLDSCMLKEESIIVLGDCMKCNPGDPNQRCSFYIPWEKKIKERKHGKNYHKSPHKNHDKNLIYHRN